MDIFVWDEEQLRNNLSSLQNEGLKICRIFPGSLYSFRINPSCYIDVYILRKLKGIKTIFWQSYCFSLANHETPKKFFRSYREIEFLGEKCLCPDPPEKLLEFWYGPDWRIPVRGHKFLYRVKSAHYAHLFFGRIKRAVKFIFNKQYRQEILQRKKETGNFFRK